jgi:hypothetical protein
MTLDDLLLHELAYWTPPGEGRHSFGFRDPNTQTNVQIVLERLEALSCQLWEASVARPAAVLDGPALTAWATRIAERVTGLLEPLHLLEVDPERGQALLRSDQPAAKNEDLFYYEVLLQRDGTASVRRYRGARQPNKRQQIGFVLTREALAKLVRDLADN